METQSDLGLNLWREKFLRKELTQDDLDRLNAITRKEREYILNSIPTHEDVFMYLSIDEDVNGDLFFIRAF